MKEPLRILNIVGDMGQGGMESFVNNLYMSINRDRVQFDVIINRRLENDYVDGIKEMGGIVYQIPRLSQNPFANLSSIYRIVKKNKYKAAVRHTSNALVAFQLLAARMAGAYTICHSHTETDPQRMMHRLGKLFMGIAACERLACSQKAGEWMFGKKSFRIIKNAIDISKYVYNPEAARRIRDEFELGGRLVFGHIGNLKYPKNHIYLLSVYKELAELDPEAVFFCVGEGELRESVEDEIKRLGMEKKVILTGMRTDVADFMSCFDVMIFPSIFEGIPLTLIEAQAAGLPCLISDRITDNVVVTEGLIEKESIEKSPKAWAKRALALAAAASLNAKRECQYESIAEAGYDIGTLAGWYEEYFERLAERGKGI